MYATSSNVDVEIDNLLEKIYQNYQPAVCENHINATHCAFSNLTYNQWLSGAVLKTPIPGQKVDSLRYVNQYQNYSQLAVSPELGEYLVTTSQTSPAVTIADVYQSFNVSGLFNGKIYQDIWLDVPTVGPGGTKWSNAWTTPSFQEYIRFVTTSYGLTGIFTYRSPREMIEGYVDPII